MSARVLFVLGEPGIGKTTLVRFLIRDVLERDPDGAPGPAYHVTLTEPPAPKWTIASRPGRGTLVAAGHYTGGPFDGGDTIPYTGARAALEYWRDTLAPSASLTVLDGRLQTKPSLEFLLGCEAEISAVYLVGDASARRAARASAAGTELQNASWVKGAATRAKNFAALVGAVEIDARESALAIAGRVFDLVVRD